MRDYREVKVLKSHCSGKLMTEKNPRIYNCSVEGMHITVIVYSITNKMLLHGKKKVVTIEFRTIIIVV